MQKDPDRLRGTKPPSQWPWVIALAVLALEHILKTPEEDHDAGEVQEAGEILDVILVSDRDAAEGRQPGEEAFDLPAPFVAAEFAAVL